MEASFDRRHRDFLRALGILDRPWLILGSAPAPQIPPSMDASHARIDINNAGRTAQDLGLRRADLTFRARRKSWEEHRNLDTRALLWVHKLPPLLLRLQLWTKPHRHVGRILTISKQHREELVGLVGGTSLQGVGELGKVTNGVAAACYGLHFGVPEIVLAGMSLTRTGHSYDDLDRRRRQIDEDALILNRLAGDARLATTEPDLARDSGIRLWAPPAGAAS